MRVTCLKVIAEVIARGDLETKEQKARGGTRENLPSGDRRKRGAGDRSKEEGV